MNTADNPGLGPKRDVHIRQISKTLKTTLSGLNTVTAKVQILQDALGASSLQPRGTFPSLLGEERERRLGLVVRPRSRARLLKGCHVSGRVGSNCPSVEVMQ
ncbi:unnamed protein product, partial [Ixodes persulcatus]